jgi:hypothetical protein
MNDDKFNAIKALDEATRGEHADELMYPLEPGDEPADGADEREINGVRFAVGSSDKFPAPEYLVKGYDPLKPDDLDEDTERAVEIAKAVWRDVCDAIKRQRWNRHLAKNIKRRIAKIRELNPKVVNTLTVKIRDLGSTPSTFGRDMFKPDEPTN